MPMSTLSTHIIPDSVCQQLEQTGLSQHHLQQLRGLPREVLARVNWTALYQLLSERGPGFLAEFLKVFQGEQATPPEAAPPALPTP